MFLVKRFRDVKGNKKIDIRDSSSGTLAYMCPTCFNIIYAHCNYDIHYKFDIDDVAMNLNISFKCKKCGNIVSGIELDPNMAYAISELNKKGYYTLFCCEGHFANKEPVATPYIYFINADNIDEDNIPECWHTELIGINSIILRADIVNYPKNKCIKNLNNWVDSLHSISPYNLRTFI